MRCTSSNIIYKAFHIPVKIGNFQKTDTTGLKEGSHCCQALVGRQKFCKECNKKIVLKTDEKLLKLFPLDKDNFRVVTDEQVQSLKDFDDTIEVLGTIKKTSIDYRLVCGAFAVLPDKPKKKKSIKMFEKAYKVFERSVFESEKAIIVKFSTRQKQKIGIMTSINNVITLLQIVYDDQFNEIDEIPQIEISENEKKQGIVFLENLNEVNVSDIENDFAVKLEELIIHGEPLAVQVPQEESHEELDFFKQ